MRVLDPHARRARHASDSWRAKRGDPHRLTARAAARAFGVPPRLVRVNITAGLTAFTGIEEAARAVERMGRAGRHGARLAFDLRPLLDRDA